MTTDPLADVAHALRLLLRRARKPQVEVANEMGAGRSQVSRYFSGKVAPKVETLFRLLAAMDADLNDLQRAIDGTKGDSTVEQEGNEIIVDTADFFKEAEELAASNPQLFRIFLYVVGSLDVQLDLSQMRVPSPHQLARLYEKSSLSAKLVTIYSERLSLARRLAAEAGGDE